MDYPAAHSMDTMWFAVDADGHVAAFDTGEGGGVPTLAFVEDHYQLAAQLRALPDTGAKLDAAAHASRVVHVHEHWRKPGHELVAFVADLAAVQDLVGRLGATVEAATTGHVLRFAFGDAAAFDELHTRDACTHCEADFSDENGELASHGVFRYACDDAIATPYTRFAVPEKPIAIADAPPEVRAHAIRFAGTFADTPSLQPAEHWKSAGWSAGWLASDGKTMRPFPDRERDFEGEDYGDESYLLVNEVLDRPDGELAEPDAAKIAPPSARVVASEPPAKKPWWKIW